MASVGEVKIVIDNTDLFNSALSDAIASGLEEIGLDCEGIASQNAPVDTGRLSGSIDHQLDGSGKKVYVGTNVEYAAFQELGTSRMSAANGGKGYLRPAATDNAGRFGKILEHHLRG